MTIDQPANPMKRNRNGTTSSSKEQTTVTSYYLHDECWESVFNFMINNDGNNNNNNLHLSSLSLVSKHFLSITNRLLFSLTICDSTCYCIFKRFTNLTSLNLGYRLKEVDKLLREISCFPLKQLTSLNITHQPSFPANGLRAFSQKITTLTSLTCSNMICSRMFPNSLNPSDLFLIAECFPLLEQLDLSYTTGCKNYSSYVDGVEALSLALVKLRKVNLSGFPINNDSIFHLFNNCKYLEEVIIFRCKEITSAGLASAIRERPTLRSLSFSTFPLNKERRQLFANSHFIDSLVNLKSLTCLVLQYLNISDEWLYSIAKECLPLTRLDLHCCKGYSYAGIFRLLSKCQCIQHLNLKGADYLNDQHVVQLSSFLGDLVSINLSGCREITYSALVALVRKCSSLSEIKMEDIGGNIVGNSDSLLEFGVYPQLKSLYLGHNSWLSDEIITMFASIFPNLQLLHLNSCYDISEVICQVLRKCCKIRHLNLTGCRGVKLLGMNFVVPKLEVLNLSNTDVDDETFCLILKNCSGLLKLSMYNCFGVTWKVNHMLENCTKLRVDGYGIYCD